MQAHAGAACRPRGRLARARFPRDRVSLNADGISSLRLSFPFLFSLSLSLCLSVSHSLSLCRKQCSFLSFTISIHPSECHVYHVPALIKAQKKPQDMSFTRKHHVSILSFVPLPSLCNPPPPTWLITVLNGGFAPLGVDTATSLRCLYAVVSAIAGESSSSSSAACGCLPHRGGEGPTATPATVWLRDASSRLLPEP